MKKSLFPVLLFLSLLALMTGCVTGRRTIDLEISKLPYNESNGSSIGIGNVEDARVFENNPPIPSTPSIQGDVNAISSSERARMIGRQRNGFGKAMGDVALPEGESVQKKSQLLVEEGLKRRGYTIASSPSSEPGYVVDVKVHEFWAWFTPGMVTISFEAKISCNVTIKGSSKEEEIRVAGYGKNSGQVASNANWQLAYERAFNDFLENFEKELDSRGL